VGLIAAAAALVVVPGAASAQPSATPPSSVPAVAPDGAAPQGPRDIVILTPGSRSRRTDLVLASLAGAAAVLGGLGLYWNLEAQSAANNVSAVNPTGLPWTAGDQHEYDRAHDSSVNAGVCYGIGGALLVGAIVGLIVTAPAPEKDVIHPRMAHALPTLAPAAGGAVVGGAWRF
jgi:hypothetical protein